MSNTFQQYFWSVNGIHNSDGDITPDYRSRVALAASEVQDQYKDDIAYAVSCGGQNTYEPPEISLVVDLAKYPDPKALHNFVSDTLSSALQSKLVDGFADTSISPTVTLLQATRHYSFNNAQKSIVDSHRKSFNIHEARAFHKRVAAIMCKRGLDMLGSQPVSDGSKNDIPPENIGNTFVSLDAWRYTALVNAKGDTIKDHITGIQRGLSDLSKETKSNAAVVVMVTSGLITVGELMWSAYNTLAPALTASSTVSGFVASVLTAAGGMTAVGGVLAVAAVAAGLLWAFLKDAANQLFVVNGQRSSTEFINDYILYGKRHSIVRSVPALRPDYKIKAYPAAFFTYKKSEIFDNSASFHGSTVGVAFKCSSSSFSIGLDAPNTILGGTNGIRVFNNSDCKSAAEYVLSRSKEEESVDLNKGKCTVRRASWAGNTNFALCLVMS